MDTPKNDTPNIDAWHATFGSGPRYTPDGSSVRDVALEEIKRRVAAHAAGTIDDDELARGGITPEILAELPVAQAENDARLPDTVAAPPSEVPEPAAPAAPIAPAVDTVIKVEDTAPEPPPAFVLNATEHAESKSIADRIERGFMRLEGYIEAETLAEWNKLRALLRHHP